MKKTAAIALSLGMLFTSIPYAVYAEAPAAASTVLSQSQAVEIAKKLVPIPEGFKMRDASLYESKGQQGPWGRAAVWNLNFAKDETRYEQGWIHISIDANTGTLLNFDINLRDDDSSIEHGLTREQAKLKAEEYLKQYAADKLNQVKDLQTGSQYDYYGPGPGNVMQSFRFVRLVNGIPYPMDGISLRLNSKGEIRGYSFNWTENLQVPTANAAVPEAQAKETFKNALNLQLQYQREYTPYGSSRETRLVYAPWTQYSGAFGMQFPMIDAVKGTAISPDGKPITSNQPEFKPLADKPGEPVTTKEITKDVAQDLIKTYNINTDGYKLESSNYSSYSSPEGSGNNWEFHYSKGDPQNYKLAQHLNVSIDAKTGELRRFDRYAYQEGPGEFPANPAVSEETARQQAAEFVKRALPTKAHQLAVNTAVNSGFNFKMGPYYAFEFVRLIDGVPMRDNGVRVVIDPKTGEIQSFDGFWIWPDNLNFPKKDDALGLEAAKGKYIDKYPLQLQYVPIYEPGKNPYESAKPNSVALVYAPLFNGPMQVLNAISGEWTSAYGPKVPGSVKPNDIAGHWAEKQLQYFVDRGIFTVKDGKLLPDAAVTRGEMVKYLITLISGPRIMKDTATFEDVPKKDPNFDVIEEAAARKWIDKNTKNFRPGDNITREELADIVTAILGYAKLSEAPDTFKNHFQDVAEGKYTGDVAIVAALGIMTGNEGRFSPTQEVSKGQAAVVMTRLLDQLKEKQKDYPYYMGY